MERKTENRTEITQVESVRTRHVIFGLFPCVKITKHYPDVDSVKKCMFGHKEVHSQPNKKPKKTGGKCFVALSNNSKHEVVSG